MPKCVTLRTCHMGSPASTSHGLHMHTLCALRHCIVSRKARSWTNLLQHRAQSEALGTAVLSVRNTEG